MSDHPSQERPIEAEYHERMNHLAALLDEFFKPYGFALLTFPMDGAKGRVNYISSADRATMLVAMKEFIARNEGRVAETATKQ